MNIHFEFSQKEAQLRYSKDFYQSIESPEDITSVMKSRNSNSKKRLSLFQLISSNIPPKEDYLRNLNIQRQLRILKNQRQLKEEYYMKLALFVQMCSVQLYLQMRKDFMGNLIYNHGLKASLIYDLKRKESQITFQLFLQNGGNHNLQKFEMCQKIKNAMKILISFQPQTSLLEKLINLLLTYSQEKVTISKCLIKIQIIFKKNIIEIEFSTIEIYHKFIFTRIAPNLKQRQEPKIKDTPLTQTQQPLIAKTTQSKTLRVPLQEISNNVKSTGKVVKIQQGKILRSQFGTKSLPPNVEEEEENKFIRSPQIIQKRKENYKVVIPNSIQTLGIKKRNYTQAHLEKFRINLQKINLDGRTSLMIKNIPNKYSQQMMKETIEMANFKGKYDFLYLPIDFQNKCNVGYAFINLKSTQDVASFVKKFNDKKWDYFNSEKICEITYARLQGLKSLRKHFQTSSISIQKDSKLKPLILP